MGEGTGNTFLRGDPNGDGYFNIGDVVLVLRWIYQGSVTPVCEDSADVNDDGSLTVADPIHSLRYLFWGEVSPAEPFSACGYDFTADDLSCESFPPCSSER